MKLRIKQSGLWKTQDQSPALHSGVTTPMLWKKLRRPESPEQFCHCV